MFCFFYIELNNDGELRTTKPLLTLISYTTDREYHRE